MNKSEHFSTAAAQEAALEAEMGKIRRANRHSNTLLTEADIRDRALNRLSRHYQTIADIRERGATVTDAIQSSLTEQGQTGDEAFFSAWRKVYGQGEFPTVSEMQTELYPEGRAQLTDLRTHHAGSTSDPELVRFAWQGQQAKISEAVDKSADSFSRRYEK